MKKTKMEKGITLIALIISIVILLILVVVTIGAVNESKIIAHSQNASSEYTIAQEKENLQLAVGEWQLQKNTSGNEETFESTIKDALKKDIESGKITVEGEEDGSLTIKFTKTGNSYTVKSDGTIVETENNEKENGGTEVSTLTLVEMYKNGENCTEENCTNVEHLHQGDYVSYSPDGAEIYTLETSMSGVEGTQKIEKEDLAWRVLGCDGTKVLLISAEPTLDGPELYGKIGYLYYEDILDGICDMYSNSSIGAKARSITEDDMDKYLDLRELISIGELIDDGTIDLEKEEGGIRFSEIIKRIGKTKIELTWGPNWFNQLIDETKVIDCLLGFIDQRSGGPFGFLLANKFDDGYRYEEGRFYSSFYIGNVYLVGYDSMSYEESNVSDGYNRKFLRVVVELDKDINSNDIRILSDDEIQEWKWHGDYRDTWPS